MTVEILTPTERPPLRSNGGGGELCACQIHSQNTVDETAPKLFSGLVGLLKFFQACSKRVVIHLLTYQAGYNCGLCHRIRQTLDEDPRADDVLGSVGGGHVDFVGSDDWSCIGRAEVQQSYGNGPNDRGDVQPRW